MGTAKTGKDNKKPTKVKSIIIELNGLIRADAYTAAGLLNIERRRHTTVQIKCSECRKIKAEFKKQ